ncbi:MAG: stage II sporulation protein D [Caldibacillus debilis]|uniref:Stage II sporulation protein D n=1 Tax=Caldibacillus debilis TaxID=301148 RepID=A0A3E0K5B4_9BACI|nr:stage II sporulation protein D [Caldibacillus debilis]OUM84039.1 MAG: stage II sporulation protein D [Caldibacillus debilis]REJ15446.1 MAG: stage II sporulation protein D [Caldibacillus debilis]REJ26292.1 MAG: stage II sporulation protein D [Caldibacillus debilis]REJ29068.1 MAG: stage II sporulation protein D [Caldibacillus debilis]
MEKVKPVGAVLMFVLIATLLIPSILVLPFSKSSTGKVAEKLGQMDLGKLIAESSPIRVSVYRTGEKKVEEIPFEQYVAGVVASEMPADFEKEALKAQSVAARTYLVKNLLAGKKEGIPEGADIGDSVLDQVYKNDEELKKIWGKDYQWKINKIRQAVYETRGKIIVYGSQPITPAYFSTSNGYTENAEDYWSNEIPYLKSVKSPWDSESPKFAYETVIPIKEFEEKLGVTLASGEVGKILSLTPGRRVKKVQIAGKEFTGREIREKLNLRSTDFQWTREGDHIVIRTKGYGHGVGMSQYGANGMAKEGKTYEEIIKYYYRGVEIADDDPFLNQQVVKK